MVRSDRAMKSKLQLQPGPILDFGASPMLAMRKLIIPAGHRALGCLVCECASAAARGGARRGAAAWYLRSCVRVVWGSWPLGESAMALAERLRPRGGGSTGRTPIPSRRNAEPSFTVQRWRPSSAPPASEGHRTYVRSVRHKQTSGAGYKRMVASRLSLPPSLLTYLLTYLRA